MSSTLNIGILAHVDAGKTSLTERVLFNRGLTREIGRVDAGTTQTDTLALERQRGITIQSAVVSFPLHGRKVNLIDTPGHPDFIAEVERAIAVLDGVVLVISAVEGVQPQTRRLSRAFRSADLPCIVFVNKIDRAGAREDALLRDIAKELDRTVLSMTTTSDIGTRDAAVNAMSWTDDEQKTVSELVCSLDDDAMDAWIASDDHLPRERVEGALERLIHADRITPVYFGSAMTGAGTDELLDGIARWFPDAPSDDDAPTSAEAFKIQRNAHGEKSVIFRLWSGQLRVRESVELIRPNADSVPAKITRIDRFVDGREEMTESATAGDIVRIHGLADARIGDVIGAVPAHRQTGIAPPIFESIVAETTPEDRPRLQRALAELAEQDPLISMRHDAESGETTIRLYGEVQKEVVESLLRDDYGIPVTFGETRVICVERVTGVGESIEIAGETELPFYARVGLRIEPKKGPESTWTFTPGMAKINYFLAAEEGGRATLEQGIHGWEVIDWDVTVIDLIYLVRSYPADYKRMATVVMADALKQAGTVVCEPIHTVELRVPVDSSGDVIHALSTHRGVLEDSVADGDGEMVTLTGTIPAASIDALSRELPGLTSPAKAIWTRASRHMRRSRATRQCEGERTSTPSIARSFSPAWPADFSCAMPPLRRGRRPKE